MGPKRNDACPCKSGKKFKQCCMRSGQENASSDFVTAQLYPGIEVPANLASNADDQRRIARIFSEAIAADPKHGCLAPVGKGRCCAQPTIKSHTVGLSRELAAIADQKNVVRGAKLKMSAIFDRGRGCFENMSIRQASTFPGFCKAHDAAIFRPIDNDHWTGADKQIFLLAYRALCREVYAKYITVESFMPAAIRNADSWSRNMLAQWNDGEKLGLEESLRDKRAMDAKLLSGDFQTRSHLVSLGADFPVRVAGVFVPEFDYENRRLYDLSNYSIPVHRISVCTITIKNDVLGVYVALDDTRELNQYLDTLERVTRSDPRAFFAQSCFDNFEHIYFNIAWWDGLRERHRIAMEARFNASGPGMRPHGMTLNPIFKFV